MKKILLATALLAPLALGQVNAGGATSPTPTTVQRHTYACTGGQLLSVQYVSVSPSAPTFVLVNYKGNQYGMAPAVTASGSRWVGLEGLNTASGLEWTEHQGQGYLSSFPSNDTSNTTTLLTCKLR